MKHFWKWAPCVVLILATSALASAQESLGDVARKERARPKPHAARVVTNEDIPSVDTSSNSTSTDEKKASEEESADKTKAGDKDKDKNGPLSTDDKIKLIEMWKGKIASQETTVKNLDDEVAKIDRDYKLRMSALYADLGNRLRDQAQWANDEKKFHEEIAAKQKEREAARDKLDSMKEEARRAGVEGID